MSKIKHKLTKDTDMNSVYFFKMNWDSIVDGKEYEVVKIYDRKNLSNEIYYDPKTDLELWGFPRDEEPCYENLIPFTGEPVSWGIRYQPYKYHHSSDIIKSFDGVYITRNGEDFCFVGYGLHYGIDKARMMISTMNEHPLNLEQIGYDKMAIGRKIWWRSEPAVITQYIKHQASIIIEPDGIDKFTPPAEFQNDQLGEPDGYIKVSIFDNHIYWFRGSNL